MRRGPTHAPCSAFLSPPPGTGPRIAREGPGGSGTPHPLHEYCDEAIGMRWLLSGRAPHAAGSAGFRCQTLTLCEKGGGRWNTVPMEEAREKLHRKASSRGVPRLPCGVVRLPHLFPLAILAPSTQAIWVTEEARTHRSRAAPPPCNPSPPPPSPREERVPQSGARRRADEAPNAGGV